MVDSIVYTFNQPVSLATVGSFTIALQSGVSVNGGAGSTVGTLPTLSWSNPSGDGVTWIVTFSGSGVLGGGSIANGVYDITLNNTDVSAVSGGGTLANPDTETFYRFGGDAQGFASNGDEAVVTTADYNQAKSAFNLGPVPGNGAYRAYFDFTGAGSSDEISTADYNTVKGVFNSGLTYSGFTPTI